MISGQSQYVSNSNYTPSLKLEFNIPISTYCTQEDSFARRKDAKNPQRIPWSNFILTIKDKACKFYNNGTQRWEMHTRCTWKKYTFSRILQHLISAQCTGVTWRWNSQDFIFFSSYTLYLIYHHSRAVVLLASRWGRFAARVRFHSYSQFTRRESRTRSCVHVVVANTLQLREFLHFKTPSEFTNFIRLAYASCCKKLILSRVSKRGV